jgi:hypothetical protein
MSKKMKCTNCGFGDHHRNSSFCSNCGSRLTEKNFCLNEDCKNSNMEHCDCDIDSKYCHLCGGLTMIGKFEENVS